jgi:ssDNA-binding Zn-finger/Zn-ribbon topoisomerase 1
MSNPSDEVNCPVCNGTQVSKVTNRKCTRCENGKITRQLYENLMIIRKDLQAKILERL